MIEVLLDPWRDPVTLRAIAEVSLIGVAGGVLGCWIVFYGLAYGAESLSHGLFPGLVGAALLGLPLLLGAAGGLLAASLAVALAARVPGLDRDTPVAIVVTSLFGLGVLLALSAETPPGLGGLLFGDVLGLTDADLLIAAVLVAALLAALAVLHPRLLAVAFDRASARGLGIAPFAADAAVLVALAVALLVAVQGLGNLLVVALLVGPAATARLLARRMAPMMAVAAAIGVACGIAGIYASYHLDTAAGASIAVAMVLAYAAVSAATTLRADGRARQAPLG
ncbi:MAG: metal ABC transporter permease [Solirubrobacteraceae bacterium]